MREQTSAHRTKVSSDSFVFSFTQQVSKVKKIPTIFTFQKQLSLEERQHVTKRTQHLAGGGVSLGFTLEQKHFYRHMNRWILTHMCSYRSTPLFLSIGKTDLPLEEQ